jgi:hypothetical protein
VFKLAKHLGFFLSNSLFLLFLTRPLKAVGAYDYAPLLYYHLSGILKQNGFFSIKVEKYTPTAFSVSIEKILV